MAHLYSSEAITRLALELCRRHDYYFGVREILPELPGLTRLVLDGPPDPISGTHHPSRWLLCVLDSATTESVTLLLTNNEGLAPLAILCKISNLLVISSGIDGPTRELQTLLHSTVSRNQLLNDVHVEWWFADSPLLHRREVILDREPIGPDFAEDPSTAQQVPSYMLDQNTDPLDFFIGLNGLLGTGQHVMGPDSESALWKLYLDGMYLKNEALLSELAAQVLRLRARAVLRPASRRATAWLFLVQGLIWTRLGKPKHALSLFDLCEASGLNDDAEITAWIWNGRSIAYGKLEDDSLYIMSTKRAIEAGEQGGITWLAQSARLRHLHKLAWAAAEDGNPLANDAFSSALARMISTPGELSPRQETHIAAQSDAYFALQYTWQPDAWSLADEHIRSAQNRFGLLGDTSEFTRMASEQGRLLLLSGSGTRAVRALQDGLRRRLLGGEYPRARYDLLWLGQALGRVGMNHEAEVCLLLSLALHEQMYGVANVDKGIVRETLAALSQEAHFLRDAARRHRIENEFLEQSVSASTGLSSRDVAELVDLDSLLRTVRLHGSS